jgi:hypothetical protein
LLLNDVDVPSVWMVTAPKKYAPLAFEVATRPCGMSSELPPALWTPYMLKYETTRFSSVEAAPNSTFIPICAPATRPPSALAAPEIVRGAPGPPRMPEPVPVMLIAVTAVGGTSSSTAPPSVVSTTLWPMDRG